MIIAEIAREMQSGYGGLATGETESEALRGSQPENQADRAPILSKRSEADSACMISCAAV